MEKLAQHELNCTDHPTNCSLPQDGQHYLRFKNYHKMEQLPYIVFADFECSITETNPQRHVPNSVGYVCLGFRAGGNIGQSTKQHEILDHNIFAGDQCVEQFIYKMIELQKQLEAIPIVPIIMTEEAILNFQSAKKCHICKKILSPNDGKNPTVRDHDHFTGAYRGAAHSKCNLKLRNTSDLSIFFHCGRNYDFHLLVEKLGMIQDIKLDCIAENKEKFKCITVNQLKD